jgi:hypothetical protein
MCNGDHLINILKFSDIGSLKAITKFNKRRKLVPRCGLLTFVCSCMLRGVCAL